MVLGQYREKNEIGVLPRTVRKSILDMLKTDVKADIFKHLKKIADN